MHNNKMGAHVFPDEETEFLATLGVLGSTFPVGRNSFFSKIQVVFVAILSAS